MPSETLITCFTDLRGSTEMTERLGNEGFLPILKDHLNAGIKFAKFVGGKYIKNAGDAHIVTFTQADSALQFAMLLQQYCVKQPCLSQISINVKIGLGMGQVEVNDNDIFGAGANEAARVQGEAKPGQVLINKSLCDALQKSWGDEKLRKYISNIGEFELRGLDNPPRHELFDFAWQKYSLDYPNLGLSRTIMDHFNHAQVEPNRIGANDLAHAGTIIWPVVPRDIVTAIHQSQAEIIRLLAKLGWQINLLIADCGAKRSYDREYSQAFTAKLERHLLTRGIDSVQVNYMSELYLPSHPDYTKVHTLFKEVSSKLTLDDLLAINNKTYNRTVKDEIMKAPTLDCLRPALSLAAVLYFAELTQRKAIVVAGFDEEIQWKVAYKHPNTQSRIGVLMNPVLNVDREHQEHQEGQWPSWVSQNDLRRGMDSGNLAWWTFYMHAFLPAFPAQSVTFPNGSEVIPAMWPKNNEFDVPSQVDKDQLASAVWGLLSKAS